MTDPSNRNASSDPAVERTVRIRNRAGMHARPAAAFVKLAGKYRAEIQVARDGLEVNGKSIMGVLMLAAEQGSELRLRGEGEDAREALEALAALVEDGFGDAGSEEV
ncbi:MAG: HPr family phosphocarrier protein [Gemmatimonadales bacterium]|nr:MAG: HPr family phosphocarrier protein [Gemmatimonadales bacterium]